MTIVFDLDNTLVDGTGSTVRPGIVALLAELRRDGHRLVLWTNSRRDRAMDILREHDLRRYFHAGVCREDYDPEDRDVPKDIRIVGGDILVDDDRNAVAWVRSKGRRGFVVRPFRRGDPADPRELAELRAAIRGRLHGVWGRLATSARARRPRPSRGGAGRA